MSSLFESDYLYGLHDPGGEQHMLDAGTPGWIVFTEGIGHDPNDRSGGDYRSYSNRGLGVITRLNNAYYPNGTIPNSRYYVDFAQRCANYVANSPGCKIWIIGNEPNYRIERPPAVAGQSATPTIKSDSISAEERPGPEYELVEGPTGIWARITRSIGRLFGGGTATAPSATTSTSEQPTSKPPADDPYLHGISERFSAINESEPIVRNPLLRTATQATMAAIADGQEVITPALYADCFRLCRDAIRRVPGHEGDQVLIAAVAPWNNQTKYAGNTLGDWVQYFSDVLALLGPDGCDGMTLHAYTHQADANLITSDTKMNPPFANRHFEFRVYRDFMAAIPENMRKHPVYITETDQDVPWLDQNIEWVQRAYGEIDWWNRQEGNQKIRSLVLYRYPPIDRWVIQGKDAVVEDFRLAMRHGYRWRTADPTTIQPGAIVATTDLVNLRRTAGYRDKPSNDVLWQMPNGTESTVVSGPQSADGLTWWQVRVNGGEQQGLVGWTAVATGAGQALLQLVRGPDDGNGDGDDNGTGGGTGDFKAGDTVETTTVVRMRRTPGYLNKPATDVVTDIPTDSLLTVLGGPRNADGLIWWQVRSVTVPSQEGWMAQTRANGDPLLTLVTDVVEPPVDGTFKKNDLIATTTVVRMRRTPGYNQKPAGDVIADINQGTQGTILDGPRSADNLAWWQVRTTAPDGTTVSGWMAEAGPNGVTLLEKVDGTPPVADGIATGDIVAATTGVRLRTSPGYVGKPPSDVLGDFRSEATVNIISGPRTADGLTWWQVGGVISTGQPLVGWSAEAVGTTTLLAPPTPLAGTSIPNKATNSYLPMPFQGSFGIAQLWGENPQIYSTITYDGVPLRGHNGIDFLTPTGTVIVAIENGVIEQAVYDDPTGFGHFIKVRHSWGEALYAHLSRIDVQVGQQVVRGNVLGATGNTGFTYGPHLHFAIRINPYSRTDGWGGFSDPLPYLMPQRISMPPYVLTPTTTRSTAQSIPTAMISADDLLVDPDELAAGSGYAPDQVDIRRP